MIRYLQRIFPVTTLKVYEEVLQANNKLQHELQRATEDRNRLTAELSVERGAHLKEIKQLANYVTITYGQMPIFPDLPYPKQPEPEVSATDVLADELRNRADERRGKRNEVLDGMELMPGKGHPIAQQTLAKEQETPPN